MTVRKRQKGRAESGLVLPRAFTFIRIKGDHQQITYIWSVFLSEVYQKSCSGVQLLSTWGRTREVLIITHKRDGLLAEIKGCLWIFFLFIYWKKPVKRIYFSRNQLVFYSSIVISKLFQCPLSYFLHFKCNNFFFFF